MKQTITEPLRSPRIKTNHTLYIHGAQCNVTVTQTSFSPYNSTIWQFSKGDVFKPYHKGAFIPQVLCPRFLAIRSNTILFVSCVSSKRVV